MHANDWEILDIPPGSSVEIIKSAFRRKVGQCHPDVCPGDAFAASRLREIVLAYHHLLADTETAFRADSLFKTPARPVAVTLTIQPRRMTRTVNVYAQRALARCHQFFQTLMFVLVLTAPVATVVLGTITLRPAIYRALQEAPAYKKPKSDTDEVRTAIALIKLQNQDAERLRNVSITEVKP